MSLALKIATVCFLRRDKKTLFIDYRNTPHPIHIGKFSAPGGKVNENETPENGAIREVFEETNIIAGNLIYRGKVTFLNEKRKIEGKPMKNNWLVYFYDCYDFNDDNARTNEGDLIWIDNDRFLNLPEREVHQGDRIIWKEWLEKYKQFEGEIEHEGESLKRYSLLSSKSKTRCATTA